MMVSGCCEPWGAWGKLQLGFRGTPSITIHDSSLVVITATSVESWPGWLDECGLSASAQPGWPLQSESDLAWTA